MLGRRLIGRNVVLRKRTKHEAVSGQRRVGMRDRYGDAEVLATQVRERGEDAAPAELRLEEEARQRPRHVTRLPQRLFCVCRRFPRRFLWLTSRIRLTKG